MRLRIGIFSLILSMAFSTILINSSEAYGRSHHHAKTKVSKKTKVKVARGKARASRYQARSRSHHNNNRLAMRHGRTSVHNRTVAYKRAFTRSVPINNILLSKVGNYIEQDDLRGEDLELRRVAVDALAGHAGTVVIMDPNNGRIHSIVNQNWAVGKPVKPCSTIKLITSIAALNEGVADPDYPTTISGGGSINMINALAYSNNEYFQGLGMQLGFDQMINYARDWGLGSKTGINVEGESAGFLPDYKSPQALPRMCSHGDDIGVTAVQLAVLTSAIANGGYIYQPQILRTEKEKQSFKPTLLRKVTLSEADREKLIEGMLGAVSYGTARRSGAAPLNVAGKTGSCNGEESKLGLFASFTSPNNPELVVVVVSTGSNEKGAVEANVAGDIYNKISDRLGKAPKQSRPVVEEAVNQPSQQTRISQRPRRVGTSGQSGDSIETQEVKQPH
jgi:membrane peptidoglycan carboxypeptidase